MKRFLSLIMALGLFAVSAGVLVQVHASDGAEGIDEISDDVSLDLELDNFEEDALAESEMGSVLEDVGDIAESILDDQGELDEDVVSNVLDDLETQVSDVLEGDVESLLENGVLDQYYQESDMLNGQRRYLSKKLKDRLRQIGKWNRKIIARFKAKKGQLKEHRKNARKKVRSAKGTLRTLLRQGKKLNKKQWMKAKKRFVSTSRDADMKRKDQAKVMLKKRAKRMRDECKADKAGCKKKLIEHMKKKKMKFKEKMRRMDEACQKADDVAECRGVMEDMKQMHKDKAEKMKENARELRDLCKGSEKSDVCKEKRREIKGKMRDMMEKKMKKHMKAGMSDNMKGVMKKMMNGKMKKKMNKMMKEKGYDKMKKHIKEKKEMGNEMKEKMGEDMGDANESMEFKQKFRKLQFR